MDEDKSANFKTINLKLIGQITKNLPHRWMHEPMLLDIEPFGQG
jgi:hypothetical protein